MARRSPFRRGFLLCSWCYREGDALSESLWRTRCSATFLPGFTSEASDCACQTDGLKSTPSKVRYDPFASASTEAVSHIDLSRVAVGRLLWDRCLGSRLSRTTAQPDRS